MTRQSPIAYCSDMAASSRDQATVEDQVQAFEASEGGKQRTDEGTQFNKHIRRVSACRRPATEPMTDHFD
jgi:hypothetical protein